MHRASAIGHLGEAFFEGRFEPSSERGWQAAADEPQRQGDRRAVPDAMIGKTVTRMQVAASEGEPLRCRRDADLAGEALLKHGD